MYGKVGSRYLVKDIKDGISEIIVLEISKKAIKIKLNNVHTQWYLKDSLPFEFIEELYTVNKLEWEQNPSENLMIWNKAIYR